jgi:hypothetical protein
MATDVDLTRRWLDHVALDDRWHRRLRRVARIMSVVVLGIFAALALRGTVPRTPEYTSFERPVQLALLAVVGLGAVVAMRFEGLGGAMMLVGGTLLGVVATIEFSPLFAFLAFVSFATPATLHLLGWQRTRSVRAVVAVLVATGLVATAGGVAAARLHDHYFGPTHPASAEPQRPVDLVEWMWAGGTTATSSIVKAKLRPGLTGAVLLVGRDSGLTGAAPVEPAGVDERRIATFELARLAPATTYHVAVKAGGHVEQQRRGRLRTFPAGAASFSFAFASCARTGSNGAVFDAVRAEEPLFFLATGDLFYGDVTEDDPDRFAALYDGMLSEPGPSALYRSTSFVYTWDDHDFGGNDASASSPSRPAALETYDEYVPHYPYALPDAGVIAQAFTVGRVRVVITDGRAARSPSSEQDGSARSMLGERQRAWLVAELTSASRTHALVVWVSASPWITRSTTGPDSWEGFSDERRFLSDALQAAGVRNVLMVSGDAHMLAIDDGTNNRFSTNGEPAFPVFHGAPIDRPASVKGGPYSEGIHVGAGQYGLVAVHDDGSQLEVTLTGRTWDGQRPLTYTFNAP